MVSYVDFAEIKSKVSIEQLIGPLGLKLKQHGAQFRGPCTVCKSGGDRSLAINTDKQSYYCFANRKGGDLIALAAHVLGIGQREAALEIARLTGTVNSDTVTVHSSRNSSTQPQKTAERESGLRPLDYLEAEHEAVQALGVSPETASAWGAGYAPKGIMRGRLTIPIHDRDGKLLAYCGRSVRDESPTLIFPNGFVPASIIFNAHRIGAGELYLVRDPLQALLAQQSGVDNVVAFLTDAIAAQQLEMLAALMDECKCETINLF